MTEQGASASFAKVGVTADPELAALVREDFAAWLRTHLLLDPEKSSDVLLAVYEALANAAGSFSPPVNTRRSVLNSPNALRRR